MSRCPVRGIRLLCRLLTPAEEVSSPQACPLSATLVELLASLGRSWCWLEEPTSPCRKPPEQTEPRCPLSVARERPLQP